VSGTVIAIQAHEIASATSKRFLTPFPLDRTPLAAASVLRIVTAMIATALMFMALPLR
jgi:hypothetical protein